MERHEGQERVGEQGRQDEGRVQQGRPGVRAKRWQQGRRQGQEGRQGCQEGTEEEQKEGLGR